MTAYTTQTLVANLQWDGDSAVISNAVPAANYYGGQGAIQTILYNVADFQGLITVQATLNDLQESAPWFDVATFGDPDNAITTISSTTVIGNFTWLRAEITEFAAGNVNAITASY